MSNISIQSDIRICTLGEI